MTPGCATNPVDPSQVTLPGTGAGSVTFPSGGASATLNLFGGIAVYPATNQAFVAQSGSGTIQIINLVPDSSDPTGHTLLKSAQITELQVPTVSGTLIGGISGALTPQGTFDFGLRPRGRQDLWFGF